MAERRTRTTRLDERHSPRSRPAEGHDDLDETDRYRGRHEAYGEAAGWTRRKAVVAIAGTTLAAAACTRAATSPKVQGLIEPGLHNIFAGDLNSAVPAAPPLATPSAPAIPAGPDGMAGAPSGGAAKYSGRTESWAGAKEPAGGTGKKAPPSTSAGQGTSLKDAAARARPTKLGPLVNSPAQHLASRLTFGSTPALVGNINKIGLDAWFAQQLAPTTTTVAALGPLAAEFPTLAMSAQQVEGMDNQARDQLKQATIAMQMWSPNQLQEAMVDLWSQHFNVQLSADGVRTFRHVLDAKIRANALGNFTNLLLAVGRDPAMIRYLNQNDSKKGQVNENLAREHLELHTMGANGGYTEADVRNFAYVLTGRNYNDQGVFEYRAGDHQTGPVTILGAAYPNASADAGLALGDGILRRVASLPATASYVSRKIATRFVSDTPPAALIARMATTFLRTKGDIKSVLKTMVTSLEFWAARGQKVMRPAENLVATARALNVRPGAETKKGLDDLANAADRMGHGPLDWPTPDGYPDAAAAWESSSNMVEQWASHRMLAQGGNGNFTYTAPEAQYGGPVPATYGAAVDVLTNRLAGQRFAPAHRTALLTFLKAGEATPVASPDLKGMLPDLLALIRDSYYNSVR